MIIDYVDGYGNRVKECFDAVRVRMIDGGFIGIRQGIELVEIPAENVRYLHGEGMKSAYDCMEEL